MTEISRKGPSGTGRWGLLAAVVLAVLALDQLTKWWALGSLTIGSPRDIFWTLRFNLAFNTGMAFSTGSGAGPVIGIIAIGIAVVMVVFARRVESRYQLVLVAMIIGGALGNVVDRLTRSGEVGSGSGFMGGGVVDFIDLQWWPVFNIADAAVVVGGIALALASFREVEDDSAEPEAETDVAVGAVDAVAEPSPSTSAEPAADSESSE